MGNVACRCGCGQAVKEGSNFQQGHAFRLVTHTVEAFMSVLETTGLLQSDHLDELMTESKAKFGGDWASDTLRERYAKYLDRAVAKKLKRLTLQQASQPNDQASKLQERMNERLWTGQTGVVKWLYDGEVIECPARVYKYDDATGDQEAKVNVKVTMPGGGFAFTTCRAADFTANSIFDSEA